MTSSNDVDIALKLINNAYPQVSSTALMWIKNDIVKKKLAQAYDAWMSDLNDHGVSMTLTEHIVYYINNKEQFEWLKEQSE